MTISSRTDQAADHTRRIKNFAELNTSKHAAADSALAKEKLASAKEQQASCKTCQHFKTLKYTTSCKLRDKQIKGYCICHLWEKKA